MGVSEWENIRSGALVGKRHAWLGSTHMNVGRPYPPGSPSRRAPGQDEARFVRAWKYWREEKGHESAGGEALNEPTTLPYLSMGQLYGYLSRSWALLEQSNPAKHTQVYAYTAQPLAYDSI